MKIREFKPLNRGKHRTSNIEHPTPNIEGQRESSLTSAFGVRCWTFDVFPGFKGEREVWKIPRSAFRTPQLNHGHRATRSGPQTPAQTDSLFCRRSPRAGPHHDRTLAA